MKKLIFFLLTAITFASCTTFKDDPTKWVFSEGGWVIPLVGIIGAGLLIRYAFKIHHQGTKIQKPKGEGGGFYFNPDIKTPVTELWFFWAGVVVMGGVLFYIVDMISSR